MDVKLGLSKRLASLHFVLHGNTLVRDQGGMRILLEIQRDAKYGTKDILRFTLNVGLVSQVLQDFENLGVDDPMLVPQSDLWHWNSRFGFLLPELSDRWWVISDENSVQLMCAEIFDGIVNCVFPKLEPLADVDQLLTL